MKRVINDVLPTEIHIRLAFQFISWPKAHVAEVWTWNTDHSARQETPA